MEFLCKIGTAAGRVLNQTEEALSEAELRQRLQAAGYYVFSIEPKELLRARLRGMRRRRIRPDDFLVFNQQFLTLSKSGLPLQKSLDMLARQTRSEELRVALEDIRERVRAGDLLSEAFEEIGQFPKIYSASLRAGERSGNLDRVLGQYITYQKATRSFRKKFLSALIYPAFLLVFLSGLIAFVITFIVPRFALLYSDLGVELPALTRFVIEFSLGVKRLGPVILAAIVGAALLLRAAWSSPATRLGWDRVKLRLPVVGKLLLKFSVAEFARTLATLLQGGIPIVSALETARDSVSSPLLARAIGQAQAEVTTGRSLSASLKGTGFFPEVALDMLEVGETTGALPSMLEGLAEFFEEDVNIDLATLVALVDPLMIASIAVVVAFILIAFYLPLFSMAAQVH
ncbi:MAG: type II secretion system F family protein [Acidobacteriia bacterium]|nr:type II secretion system F family protein [Terriglobia bacterium]